MADSPQPTGPRDVGLAAASTPRITAVVPTYNEAENIERLVAALIALPLDVRVLIVDDNSPDGTGRLADQLAEAHRVRVRVLHRVGERGLRSAYLAGFRAAMQDGADAIAQMDADFSHDPRALVDMAAALVNNDLVIGSRYVPGGSVDRRWPLWRKWLSRFGNAYARVILRLPIRDCTTGYRLWSRRALERLPLERLGASGYVFLVEMAYMAHCLGCRIAQVPIYFADRRWGKSKMSLRIQIEAAIRVWQVKWAYRDLVKTARASGTGRAD